MTEFLTDRDIIITGLQPWDYEYGSNCKDIASKLSEKNRILYVNYPLDRITIFRKFFDKKILNRLKSYFHIEENLKRVDTNIWMLNPRIILESISKIRNRKIYDYVNHLNNRRYAAAIQKSISELSMKDPILFIDNDFQRGQYLFELLKPSISIYYIRDNLTIHSYFKNHGKRLEKQLITKSDIVFTNSEYLKNYSSQFNSNSHFIGQGFNVDNYLKHAKFKLPEDLREIKRPIVGYIGALLDSRLDRGLIEYIALNLPDYQFVFVGPEDELFMKSNLHSIKNIYFLGRKDFVETIDYLKNFDVCINPQKINELTIGNYPRKIDEYLALGKPIVAMKTESMEMFNKFVYLAKNHEEFSDLIINASRENNEIIRRKRIDFARTHTWDNCIKNMDRYIQKYYSTRA